MLSVPLFHPHEDLLTQIWTWKGRKDWLILALSDCQEDLLTQFWAVYFPAFNLIESGERCLKAGARWHYMNAKVCKSVGSMGPINLSTGWCLSQSGARWL